MTDAHPNLAVLAALSENRVIGRDGRLPWHLPRDLKRVKTLTTGHAMIMGRKTFESIGRPLPGRRTIVITRRTDWRPCGVEIAHDLGAALRMVGPDETAFVCGGEAVYREAIPLCSRMHLTIVHAVVEGDVHFPQFDEDEWELVEDERFPADERHAYAVSFRAYRRRNERPAKAGPTARPRGS